MKKILILLVITTLTLTAAPYIMSKYLEYHIAIDDNIVTVDIPNNISKEEQTRIFCSHALKYVKDNELSTEKAVFIYFFTSIYCKDLERPMYKIKVRIQGWCNTPTLYLFLLKK